MNADGFDYPRLIREALRAVPRAALRDAGTCGPLPEPHELYLTFRTDHPEVGLASYLRDSYPSEMTIVLKTQFRDLEVDDEGFSVTLFFSGTPESLYIPFDALIAFVDRGAEFGLRFDGEPAPGSDAPGSEDGPKAVPPEDGESKGADVVSIDSFRRPTS